jgi:hypothetical protein
MKPREEIEVDPSGMILRDAGNRVDRAIPWTVRYV